MSKWTKDMYGTVVTDVDGAIAIIEDALANGFEFKVENHSLYFREISDACED